MLKPTTIASNLKFGGRVIDVSTERLKYANGREYDIDFVRHPGAAAVVAVDARDRLCVVRQYRHGIADFLWEIPAGKLDRGEAPEACAVRELAEETGVTAQRLSPLGLYLPAPGIFTEVIHLFLAEGLATGAARPDADEELEIDWVPFAEALERVARGEWNDGKTAMALLRTQYRRDSVKSRQL
ncbi:MAG TPA: NUDIX hydrolase [Steroidobacteraceae bacterium]|jgi:ADP-ribose pyrophosphatase|nr:NUDIX hydrolase [Steroidobacteraceae bacterium]